MQIVAPKRYLALVEIGASLQDELLEALLMATYRASCREPSAVLLRDLATSEADRILDPVVAEVGAEAAGLIYLTDRQEDDFVGAVNRADMVVVYTEALRRRLASSGFDPLSPRDGVRALRDVPGPMAAGDGGRSRMVSTGG